MTEDEAFEVLGVLVAAFNGWSEPKMELFKSQLMELADPVAAVKTAKAMANEATETFVPAFGSFKATYDRWVRRLEEQRTETMLALQSGEYSKMRFPTYAEGVLIAQKAYEAECARQGRAPTPGMVESWLGKGRQERRDVARGRARA